MSKRHSYIAPVPGVRAAMSDSSPSVFDRLVQSLPYQDENDNLRLWIRVSHRVILGLSVLVLVLVVGWLAASKTIRVSIPPDIRYGATVSPGDHDPARVFNVGAYLFQFLNRWENNGATDYPAKIDLLRHYLTPECKAWLDTDADRRLRRGELTNRSRMASPPPTWLYKDDLVKVVSDREWILTLDMKILEYQGSTVVKDILVRYPLRVVAWDADPENNPWGLALDCFESTPQRLSAKVGDSE